MVGPPFRVTVNAVAFGQRLLGRSGRAVTTAARDGWLPPCIAYTSAIAATSALEQAFPNCMPRASEAARGPADRAAESPTYPGCGA
jgi:hypothetical protein